jgi:hypothetical protein
MKDKDFGFGFISQNPGSNAMFIHPTDPMQDYTSSKTNAQLDAIRNLSPEQLQINTPSLGSVVSIAKTANLLKNVGQCASGDSIACLKVGGSIVTASLGPIQKLESHRIANDPYWQNMPKDDPVAATLYSVKVGGESTFDPSPGDPGGCNTF